MSERPSMCVAKRVAGKSVVLAGIMALAWQAHAAELTRIVGGPGGAPFVDRPERGARVGALAIGAGALIDSVSAVYQTPDGRRFPSARHGGPGGGPCVIALDPDERIVAIRGRHGQYVESIQIITNKRMSRVCGGPGGGTEFRIDVPPNHTVVGWAGRAGTYLDAVGLALQPVQAVAIDTPPPAPPPRPVAPPPAAPPRPVALDGKVNVRANLNDATLDFRLTGPASVEVSLRQGRSSLRPGACFPASERLAAVSPVQPQRAQHRVLFTRLAMGTDYSYAIRIGGAACESGWFTTATRIDNSQ